MVQNIFNAMEKHGMLQFEMPEEREGFLKIAQGMMDPAAMAQMAQMAGMSPMMDPSMANIPMDQLQGAVPQEAPSQEVLPGLVSPEISANAVIGESITNKDIESLIKIINVITSLKSQYDAMKKDQVAMLKDQLAGGQAAMPQM